MSLHSAPSIVWELSGEPCETRDQALSGIKNNTEAFIICSRGDEFLQATCNSPENYHCRPCRHHLQFLNRKEAFPFPEAMHERRILSTSPDTSQFHSEP